MKIIMKSYEKNNEIITKNSEKQKKSKKEKKE